MEIKYNVKCSKCASELEITDTAIDMRINTINFLVEECSSVQCEAENKKKYFAMELQDLKNKIEGVIEDGG